MSGPLHVGFVGPYPPIRGGVAQHSGRLVDALRACGHRVDVHSWVSQYPGMLYRGDQEPVTGRRTGDVDWSLRWWAPWTWVAVARRLRAVDVVVFPWVHPFHAVILWLILAISGRPSVGVVHNFVPHERLPGDQFLAGLVLGRTRGLVVHARDVAEAVGRTLPATPRMFVLHPPNLPIEPTPLPDGPPRVLFLGYVRSYKGVDVLLDALTDPVLAAVQVTIAGEMWDPDANKLEQWVRDRGLADRVRLEPGYVEDDRIAALLAEHHLLVAPYRSATQSGLVPLAHAAGRPVVATDVGGLRDQVTNGRDGVVVSSNDAAALARGVATAWERRAALAEGAVASAPRWSAVAEAVTSQFVGQRDARTAATEEGRP